MFFLAPFFAAQEVLPPDATDWSSSPSLSIPLLLSSTSVLPLRPTPLAARRGTGIFEVEGGTTGLEFTVLDKRDALLPEEDLGPNVGIDELFAPT